MIIKPIEECNICMCQYPSKKYSTGGCTMCWSCTNCNKFGGCDNQAGMTNMEPIVYGSEVKLPEPNFNWV